MLFYEPKLLKSVIRERPYLSPNGFSALLRAEIVEIVFDGKTVRSMTCFSALLRAEIVETDRRTRRQTKRNSFSALLRAEIVETAALDFGVLAMIVSVLFYEPKLLKFLMFLLPLFRFGSFSALLRAEIVEIGTQQ